MRYYLLQRKYRETVATSDRILRINETTLESLLTCYQLRGHAHIELKEYIEAEASLLKATDLGQISNTQRSLFSSIAFLMIAQLNLNKLESSKKTLSQLHEKIRQIEQIELKVDRSLILKRAEFHYYKSLRMFDEALGALIEAKTLANWLQEEACVSQCDHELSLYDENDIAKIANKIIIKRSNWDYIKSMQLLLCFEPKKITSFETLDLPKRIILALSDGPLEDSELFEKVWNLKYVSERHSQHLRSSLSSLRRLFPNGTIVYKDKKVNLV
jgi:tetratricopeptide (TPR) repeat protein